MAEATEPHGGDDIVPSPLLAENGHLLSIFWKCSLIRNEVGIKLRTAEQSGLAGKMTRVD